PRLRHGTVDRARRLRLIDPTARDAGEGAHLGREVAFVGHADQPTHRAERGNDLARGGEQRHDAHADNLGVSNSRGGSGIVGAQHAAPLHRPGPPTRPVAHHSLRIPTRYSTAPSAANSPNARAFEPARPPSAWERGSVSASASAEPNHPANAASTMPQMAPPA